MTSDSPARSRRLSTMASGVLMRLARPRARATPPTSGDTTITLARSKRSLMSRTINGDAKRLSVGMSKKPWIWAACRSSVMTRSTPDCVIRFATSFAEIGVREPFLADIDASPRALLDTTFSISSPYRTGGFRWARRYQAGGLAGNPLPRFSLQKCQPKWVFGNLLRAVGKRPGARFQARHGG